MMNPESTIDESPNYMPPLPKPFNFVIDPMASENSTGVEKSNAGSSLTLTDGLPAILNQTTVKAKGREYKSPYVSVDSEDDSMPSSISAHGKTPTPVSAQHQRNDELIPEIQPLVINEVPDEQASSKRHSEQPTTTAQPENPITSDNNSRVMESLSDIIITPSTPGNATSHISKPDSLSVHVSSTDNQLDEPFPHPMSLEAKRRSRARDFDSSELDSWLNRQQSKPDSPRPPKDLLASQIWGNIDPRVVWSEERSPEWYIAKRAEIEARPKRKANFGKLLTKQIKDDRRSKGWSVHQEEEIVYDDQTEEMNKRLEGLTGIKVNRAAVELGIRNGHLVMVEDLETARPR